MKLPARPSSRRAIAWLVPALLGLGVAGLDVGAAASQDLTSNINNFVRTATVAPPENVAASSTINLLSVSCEVTVTWTAPAMSGIGGYEVRRVLAATGVELNPPSFTTDLFYIDNRTPLTLIGNAYNYQVRSVLDGTTWRSEWVTADAGVTLLCLNLLGAAAAPDALGPDAVESVDTPEQAMEPPLQPEQPVEEPEQSTDVDVVPSTSTGPMTSVPRPDLPVSEPPATSAPPTVPPTAPIATPPTTSVAVVAGS